MIPYINIDLVQPISFYEDFDLTQDEIDMLLGKIEEGRTQDVIDYFVNENIIPPGVKYQEALSRYLLQTSKGPLKSEDRDKLIRNIALLTLGLTSLLYSNYNTFVKKVYSNNIFKIAGLTDSNTKKAINSEILNEFDQVIHGTLSQTQYFVTNSIKTLQTEIFAINAYINKTGLEGNDVDVIIKEFYNNLKKKYPEIYRSINENKILVTTRYGTEGYRNKIFKMDWYLDGIMRNSILNLDRITNITSATIAGENVVEYYLADSRSVQKDREICQSILANKVNGISVLALNDNTANKLGVMTVSEAELTPDFAMNINCRHSIKRLGKSYLKEINKMLGV